MRADADVEPNGEMLNEALGSALRLAGHDHLVVVISDFFGADVGHEAGFITAVCPDDSGRSLLTSASPNSISPQTRRQYGSSK